MKDKHIIRSINPLQAVIAGSITGAIEVCVTYPTEVIKTYMQLYKEYAKKGWYQTTSKI